MINHGRVYPSDQDSRPRRIKEACRKKIENFKTKIPIPEEVANVCLAEISIDKSLRKKRGKKEVDNLIRTTTKQQIQI